MDSLTHLLVGHAMGVAASSAVQTHSPAVYWAVLVGNSLPDIDVPLSLLLRRDIKLHRTFTHTLPGSLALSALAALVICRHFGGTPFSLVLGWSMMGCLMHMVMDALNLWGARLLWPLFPRSVDLGVLHIMDPIVLALLGIPTLGAMAQISSIRWVAVGFYLMAPYILYRIWAAHRLYHRLKAQGAPRVRIVPWYSSWRYIRETASAIEFGRWSRRGRRPMATYHKEDSPLVRATMADPVVAAFLESAEYPYAKVEADDEGFEVIWADALRQLRADFRPVRVRV